MEGKEEVQIVELDSKSADITSLPFWNWTRITTGDELSQGSRVASDQGSKPCDTDNEFANTQYDFTFLMVAGGTVGALVTLWLLYRGYHFLFSAYCAALRRQDGEGGSVGGRGAGGSSRSVLPPSVYVIESCREPGAAREGSGVRGMAGVLARMQTYRKGESPPPPYDSPPPYHVAVSMEEVPKVIVSEPVVI